MNLTADQIFEVTTAVHCGLKAADLNGLSTAERIQWLAQVKAHASRRLADPSLTASERQLITESIDLADQPDMLADRARERYYNRPARERGRNLPGQKMAMNDLLSQSHYFSDAQRAAIDARLSARELPALRSLEIALKRKHERILKRGAIRTEEEYYIVREVLADMSFDISDLDRTRFEQLAANFEGRAAR